MEGFEVVQRTELGLAEGRAAKEYWAGLGVQPHYGKQEHWNAFIAEQVIALRPKRVLELGCNVGRNLVAIRDRAPDLDAVGVDVNAAAVAAGVAQGLTLLAADEHFLDRQPAGAFDVSFTVSVLDHIADPEPVLAAMLRVSAIGVLLLEPWIGDNGKIVRSPAPNSGGGTVATTPYSYSWDYDTMLARIAPRSSISRTPYPLSSLSDSRLGAHYHLWRVIHRRSRRVLMRALRRRPVVSPTQRSASSSRARTLLEEQIPV